MSHISHYGVRRVVKPRHRYMPSRKEQDDAWSHLLSKMDAFYTEASERLAARARPVTLARFLDSGVCIGLLDPVSIIMANSVCTAADDLCPELTTVPVGGTAVIAEKMGELGKRSLEGLAAFLIYFFPYLDEWEA